ncbi:MAG: hypothetical protein H6707_13790 [Deltaproteobacteria bacterium]|nr:hypothetical protein [Deltaproteobacteria bacterium]
MPWVHPFREWKTLKWTDAKQARCSGRLVLVELDGQSRRTLMVSDPGAGRYGELKLPTGGRWSLDEPSETLVAAGERYRLSVLRERLTAPSTRQLR